MTLSEYALISVLREIYAGYLKSGKLTGDQLQEIYNICAYESICVSCGYCKTTPEFGPLSCLCHGGAT